MELLSPPEIFRQHEVLDTQPNILCVDRMDGTTFT